MSSNIRIEKKCTFCATTFIARTTVTSCCSDNCAKKQYKARKRDEKLQAATSINIYKGEITDQIKEKPFLSIKESCILLGTSRWTIHRLIRTEIIKSTKLGRRTIISRESINNLFDL